MFTKNVWWISYSTDCTVCKKPPRVLSLSFVPTSTCQTTLPLYIRAFLKPPFTSVGILLTKKRSTRRALHFREKVFYNNGVIGLGASFEVLRGIMDQDVHGGVISDVAMNGNSLSLTHMPIFLHEAIRRGEVENPYEDIRRISREIPEVQSRGNHVLGPPFYLRPRLEQSNV